MNTQIASSMSYNDLWLKPLLIAGAIAEFETLTGVMIDPERALRHEGRVKVTLHSYTDFEYVSLSDQELMHRYIFNEEKGLMGPFELNAKVEGVTSYV